MLITATLRSSKNLDSVTLTILVIVCLKHYMQAEVSSVSITPSIILITLPLSDLFLDILLQNTFDNTHVFIKIRQWVNATN